MFRPSWTAPSFGGIFVITFLPRIAFAMRSNLHGTLLATSCIIAALPAATSAQEARSETREFAILAQPLPDALRLYMRQSGIQVSYRSSLAEGRASTRVEAVLTPREALRRLLAGTGLTFRFVTPTTVSLEPETAGAAPAASEPNVVMLGSVSVTATALDDDMATQGTGSYTTRQVNIGRMGESLREMPQSVSVVTRSQLDDLNLNTVNDAIAVTTGAVLVQNDDVNERTEIFFRGLPVDSLRVDGAAVSSNNDVMMFDTAIYDRIEVLRGPSGLFQGAGQPGGTVNLVRKRAPDTFSAGVEGLVGSWQQFRGQVDIGAPLNAAGSIRARGVAVINDAESFVDLINTQRWLVFGTVDIDIAETTTLTLGGTWQQGHGRNARGLPAYADGTLADVPRSTYIGTKWDHSETRSGDLFANLEHRFDGGAVLTATASFLDRKRDGKIAFAAAAIDPVTGNTELTPEHRIDRETNYNTDAHLLVPFEMAGQEQKVLFGADYRTSREKMDRARGDEIVQNVFAPDHDVLEQDLVFDRFDGVETTQYGVYAQARLKPAAWGTLVLGGRVSWWDTRSWDRESGEEDSSLRIRAKFTPYAAAVADLDEHFSAYVSYASIFSPQEERTVENDALKPRTGSQYEVGLKGAFLDSRLNGHVALFQIDERNRAIADPDEPEFSVAAGRMRSKGFEAEIAGEVAPGWQLITGYTYAKTRYRDDPANAGLPFDPRTPRHAFRLWTHYEVRQGALQGLSIGGGLKVYGEFYRTDDGARFSQGGYATVDTQFGYDLGNGVKVAGTVTNIFDRKYFQSVGYSERQSYFGRPRAFTAKIVANW